ncbi:MAG: GMC family oxidoreductase [Actinobacteria bacterium]|nr:GMC family oxidoreductase [Actinomycetota bacterium]
MARNARRVEGFDFDWLVVGSGFGGSVAALRLTQKGYRVGVLECGRRWDDHDFATSLWNLRRSMWAPRLGLRGTMRVSIFKDITVLSGSGVGGGSLVYSNVLYRPPEEFFDGPDWAGMEHDWRAELAPHFQEAERMLGVTRYEIDGPADALMRQVAGDLNVSGTYQKPPVAVYFGEPGVTVDDPYFGGDGPARTGCTLCGACMAGCRDGAKNTLPKNYLWFAERGGAQIMPDRQVTDIRPLGPAADGSAGYAVTATRPGAHVAKRSRMLTARGVVVATGALGTNKLLQRCRLNGSLAALSPRLGERVRTNSESVLAVTSPDDRFDFSEAISITSSIFPDADTHIEPVTYGRGADAMSVMFTVLPKIGPRATQPLRFALALTRDPRSAANAAMPKGWSRRTMLMIVMQATDTSIRLRPARRLRDGDVLLTTEVAAGYQRPAPIPVAYDVARRLAEKIGGRAQASVTEAVAATPVTAHFLGGAAIGRDSEHGVVDSHQRVFGYENLLVCDGSVLPANIGVNPSLTITALAERAISQVPARG